MYRTPKHAFTLIELLVVISIISLLISILLPALTSARASSRMIQCQSNQRQLAIANEVYANDYDDTYVPVKTAGGGGVYRPWLWNSYYMTDLVGLEPVLPQPGLICPDRPDDAFHSYGWNHQDAPVPDGWFSHIEINRLNIKNPSQKLFIADATDWHLTKSMANYTIRWDVTGEYYPISVAYRHFIDIVNIVYADLHAGNLEKSATWDDPIERDQLWHLYDNY
ncbi:prepilin-type N-terminal cleavage/methylation domain-containing protein [Poriferisphaera sp. WC338]|uniref:prepilin-type N-terminal cleavage/methylation domain-containing protein n=1 Tax=Poriferisphaera sp. WC338 TaxID=3425129 RepID=UPI003D81A7E1